MTAQVDVPHLPHSEPLSLLAAKNQAVSDQLEMGKIFVGGLSRETTTNGLRVYFERFGDISDCVVMKDRSTGAPRGFGFVTYMCQVNADRVVQHRHVIDGKKVEAKPAVPRDAESRARPGVLPMVGTATAPHLSTPVPPMMMAPSPAMGGTGSCGGSMSGANGGAGCGMRMGVSAPAPQASVSSAEFSSKKIFVGGLSHETDESDFISYFGSYGQVVDCVIMCDPHTRKPRGFGFITYDDSAAVDRVCSNKFHELNGKRVEVKKAIPQDRMLSEDAAAYGCGGDEGAYPGASRAYGAQQGRRGSGFLNGACARGIGSKPYSTPQAPGGQWMKPPQNGDMNPSVEVAALKAATNAANSVLCQSTEPSSGPDDNGMQGGMSNALLNLGGNFSSATAALNQGHRTTYGSTCSGVPDGEGGQNGRAQQEDLQAQDVQQLLVQQQAQLQQLMRQESLNLNNLFPGEGQFLQDASITAAADQAAASQALQEQITHLAQQQQLLQQLQQQQLELQLVQHQQAQQNIRVRMIQQMQPPQSSEHAGLPLSSTSHGNGLAGAKTSAPADADAARTSAMLSNAMARMSLPSTRGAPNSSYAGLYPFSS